MGVCGACGAWKKTDANVNPTNAKTMVLFFVILYKCRKKRESAFQENRENTENQFRQEDRKHKMSLVACVKNRLI